MYSKKIRIRNYTGLHARPASEFVECAANYNSKIKICRAGQEEESVNAKSIVLLLTLGLCKGEEAIISANGSDEAEAVEALAALIESGFGE